MGLFSMLFTKKEKLMHVYDKSKITVIDARTPSEYAEGHVAGALNIDVMGSAFRSEILKLDKSKAYKVYCRSGNRSGQAQTIMQSLGFIDVENLGSLDQAKQKLTHN